MLKLGYKASNEQFGPTELLRYGVLAEECGFDSVFVSDHLQPWRHDGGHAPFAMSWLGALGARTERILMGTSVLTPTFRYHPGIVAQSFATLGCLFPDRVILGMGTGESLNEVALGIEWPDGKERFARFREAVSLIKQLWTEDRVTFDGTYYHTDKATIYDRPERPVPIYLAGSGPAATRYAGRVGDGYITTSGKAPELYTDTLLPAVREGAEKAGRDVADIDMMIEVKVSFDHDRDVAMEATRFWGALGLTQEQKAGVEDPVEMQRLADALSVEQTARRFIVSTEADEHVERIKTYLDLGFNHLVFHAPGPDQEKFLRLYGTEVLPRLRALAPTVAALRSGSRAAVRVSRARTGLTTGCGAPETGIPGGLRCEPGMPASAGPPPRPARAGNVPFARSPVREGQPLCRAHDRKTVMPITFHLGAAWAGTLKISELSNIYVPT